MKNEVTLLVTIAPGSTVDCFLIQERLWALGTYATRVQIVLGGATELFAPPVAPVLKLAHPERVELRKSA